MSDNTTNLLLPYILAAQAQKHITHNEALLLLDGIVQLSVINRSLTAPPPSSADGDRYIVASGATGLWAGWDLNVAFYRDGGWIKLIPRVGWVAHSVADAAFYVWNGSAWTVTPPNIIGTVSQSAGVPTGAIIESASNANGDYVRFADGTQICTHSLAASSSAAATWTFPAVFSAAPVVTGNALATVLSAVCLDAAPTATAVTFSARNNTNARRADTCYMCATGRWF